MEIKYEDKVITKKVVTLELDEEEALILQKIVGKIGGNHDWRKVTSGLYYGLREVIGVDKCDMFSENHDRDIAIAMLLKDKEGPYNA